MGVQLETEPGAEGKVVFDNQYFHKLVPFGMGFLGEYPERYYYIAKPGEKQDGRGTAHKD